MLTYARISVVIVIGGCGEVAEILQYDARVKLQVASTEIV